MTPRPAKKTSRQCSALKCACLRQPGNGNEPAGTSQLPSYWPQGRGAYSREAGCGQASCGARLYNRILVRCETPRQTARNLARGAEALAKPVGNFQIDMPDNEPPMSGPTYRLAARVFPRSRDDTGDRACLDKLRKGVGSPAERRNGRAATPSRTRRVGMIPE